MNNIDKNWSKSHQLGWEFPYCYHPESGGTLPMILVNLRISGLLEQTIYVKPRNKPIEVEE